MSGLCCKILSAKLHAQCGFTSYHLRGLATNAATSFRPRANSATNSKMPKAKSATTAKPTPSHEKQSKSFGLSKKEKRSLRKKLLEDCEGTEKDHVFKHLYPWRTKLALAEHLKNSEVYNSDGLIVVCKPYGIAQVKVDGRGGEGRDTVVQTLNSGGVPADTPVIKDVLPILQEMYNVDHLELVKTSERWTSGLMLLSTKPELGEHIAKCFRRSKALQQPPLTFWAITNGLPNPSVGATKVAISLECVHNIGKVPVIKKKYTSIEIKRGDSKLAVVEHSTLMHNEKNEASLVEVNIQTLKWHFLRVWLAQSYSPVLGDAIYGGRVKTLSGKKILVSPNNLTAYNPQEISDEIYHQLQLPQKAAELIPCLVHLSKMRLAQYNKDKSDLILSVPPPSHFVWTCTQLGLMSTSLPDEDTES